MRRDGRGAAGERGRAKEETEESGTSLFYGCMVGVPTSYVWMGGWSHCFRCCISLQGGVGGVDRPSS